MKNVAKWPENDTFPNAPPLSNSGPAGYQWGGPILNKILQERSGKLEDVLKIEIELSRVRGEIEQLEGKIRVLESLSSLATLTLNVRERDKYAPPPPVAGANHNESDGDRPR